MKIKYIGNFNDGTGWSKASTYNLLAIDYAGYDVYAEEMKYSKNHLPLEDRVQELMAKKSEKFDVVIHHVLPDQYKYYGGSKNIGFVEIETYNISNQTWIKNMNMMDEIWVPNTHSKNSLKRSGVNSPIKILPHFMNVEKIHNNKLANNDLNNTFNFLFVGEFIERKNLQAILRAFHSEFLDKEPVRLCIKTSGDNDLISNYIRETKQKLKLKNSYKQDILITNRLPENTLYELMNSCHCFVSASRGEAWCYPSIESMSVGMPVIYTENTGIEDYDSGGNVPVKSYLSPCYGAMDSLAHLYSSKEAWYEIDILELQKAMRLIFNEINQDSKSYESRKIKNAEYVKRFDYKNSKIIKELL